MGNLLTRFAMVALVLATGATAFCQHPGDLVVTPTKVLLDDKHRTGDITIVNRGMQSVRYRLSLVEMEMTPEGILKRVPSTANSAAPLLRLSPREIVLEPGVSQRVKVAVTFPDGTPAKEVRSHLAFEPIAQGRPTGSQNATNPTTLRLNFDLRSVVTIPVIAQHGQLAATASIADATIVAEGDALQLRFHLTRTGERTIRGDIRAYFIPAKGGKKIAIGEASAMPVYYPIAARLVTMRLTQDIRSLGKGEIEISFIESERSRGAATARTVVELSQ